MDNAIVIILILIASLFLSVAIELIIRFFKLLKSNNNGHNKTNDT